MPTRQWPSPVPHVLHWRSNPRWLDPKTDGAESAPQTHTHTQSAPYSHIVRVGPGAKRRRYTDPGTKMFFIEAPLGCARRGQHPLASANVAAEKGPTFEGHSVEKTKRRSASRALGPIGRTRSGAQREDPPRKRHRWHQCCVPNPGAESDRMFGCSPQRTSGLYVLGQTRQRSRRTSDTEIQGQASTSCPKACACCVPLRSSTIGALVAGLWSSEQRGSNGPRAPPQAPMRKALTWSWATLLPTGRRWWRAWRSKAASCAARLREAPTASNACSGRGACPSGGWSVCIAYISRRGMGRRAAPARWRRGASSTPSAPRRCPPWRSWDWRAHGLTPCNGASPTVGCGRSVD